MVEAGHGDAGDIVVVQCSVKEKSEKSQTGGTGEKITSLTDNCIYFCSHDDCADVDLITILIPPSC